MKLKLDEHLPIELADYLRQAGHDSMTVVEQGLSAAEDAEIMREVQPEGRAIFTMRKGIADVVAARPVNAPALSFFVRTQWVEALFCNSSDNPLPPCWRS